MKKHDNLAISLICTPYVVKQNLMIFSMQKIPALCLSYGAYATGLKFEYMRAGRSPNTVVASYSLDGKLIKVYPSAKKAASSLHHFKRAVDKAIRENSTLHNRIWRRFPVDEVPESIEPLFRPTTTFNPKPIGLLDENNNVIKAYPSVRNAAIDNDLDPHTIRDMLYRKTKTAKGKRFKFISEEEASTFGIVIKHNHGKIRVRQYSLDGKLVKIHDSIRAASKSIGVHSRSIDFCLNGSGKTVKDFYWIKDDENAEERLIVLMERNKYFYTTIFQIDKKGKIVAKFKTPSEAEKTTGINAKHITQAIRRNETAGGYFWKGEK